MKEKTAKINWIKCVILTLILMDISSVAARAVGSVKPNNLILSRASEALEMISLKKIWKKGCERFDIKNLVVFAYCITCTIILT